MSALDQALTKAYAKNRAPAVALPPERPAAKNARQTVAPRASASSAVERIYNDGTLYRVESPGSSQRMPSAVQAPNLKNLPPTSPRRNVRRSILRLLANHPTVAPVESVEAPPKVARKVIFRHISHAAPPPPLGLMRSGLVASHGPESELPPEIFPEEKGPTSPVPPSPAKPDPAPLNVALETTAAINIFGDWNHSASLAPMVLMESGEKTTAPWAVVSVELDALALLEQAAAQAAEHVDVEESITSKPEIEAAAAKPNVQEKSFIAKGLDDSEEPRLRFRLDSAHASATPAPHAKFKLQPQELVNKAGADIAPEITPEPANLESPDEAATTSTIPAPPQSAPSQSEVHKVAELGLDESQLDLAEPFDLTFAESSLEPLDNELVSSLELDNASASASDRASGPAGINRTASPLWEVDKFHWPRTCEKLFADDQGYLSRAGDKLLAAVQDGLRVLAITGTRRGEGRTTLALCLARSAAQAGIQVAVMDADFARPQLASKIALEVAFGWQDAALGNIPLSEAAVKSISDRVTVLPLESAAATRALSMADPRVTATIRAAAATFELLILDLGPIGSGEQLAFPPGEGCPFDAAIVVRDLRFATATESENVGEALQEAGVEAVGIAENFVVEDEIPATSV